MTTGVDDKAFWASKWGEILIADISLAGLPAGAFVRADRSLYSFVGAGRLDADFTGSTLTPVNFAPTRISAR